MIWLRRISTIASVILLSAEVCHAQTNTAPALTLNDVVRLLGDRNPKIRAEREAIASARAGREEGGRDGAALPGTSRPRLDLGLSADGLPCNRGRHFAGAPKYFCGSASKIDGRSTLTS